VRRETAPRRFDFRKLGHWLPRERVNV